MLAGCFCGESESSSGSDGGVAMEEVFLSDVESENGGILWPRSEFLGV